MTTDELSKNIMHDCRTSGLPLVDQATALGTAYVCYLLAKGVKPVDLQNFVNKTIHVAEQIARQASQPSA